VGSAAAPDLDTASPTWPA